MCVNITRQKTKKSGRLVSGGYCMYRNPYVVFILHFFSTLNDLHIRLSCSPLRPSVGARGIYDFCHHRTLRNASRRVAASRPDRTTPPLTSLLLAPSPHCRMRPPVEGPKRALSQPIRATKVPILNAGDHQTQSRRPRANGTKPGRLQCSSPVSAIGCVQPA